MKKILASVLSLAMIFAVCFSFVGCDKEVKIEETYKVSGATITLAKTIDENGEVTETETISLDEYYKRCFEDGTNTTVADLTDTALTFYNAALKEFKESVLGTDENYIQVELLNNKGIRMTDVSYNKVTSYTSKTYSVGEYTLDKEGKLVATFVEVDDVITHTTTETTWNGTLVDDVISIAFPEFYSDPTPTMGSADYISVYYVTYTLTLVA